MNGLIATAQCPTCSPWVRNWRSASTGLPIRQVLHEDRCPTYPKHTREDLAALTGD
jgi:hypothetical protein